MSPVVFLTRGYVRAGSDLSDGPQRLTTERTGYLDMVGYSLPGYDYDGTFTWFS